MIRRLFLAEPVRSLHPCSSMVAGAGSKTGPGQAIDFSDFAWIAYWGAGQRATWAADRVYCAV